MLPTSSATYFLFFVCYGHHLDLHSFPTRRSSDLAARYPTGPARSRVLSRNLQCTSPGSCSTPRRSGTASFSPRLARSEEHTSELQSHSDLVCRLLLEKKKIPQAKLPRTSRIRSNP